jgi:uncharacterized membrane protein YqjE
MSNFERRSPGFFDSGRRFLDDALGAFYNRVELLVVEFGEEKTKLIELLVCACAAVFFAVMAVIVFTATVILMFPLDYRVFAAGGFCLVYLSGAIWSFLQLNKRLKQNGPPFAETINELKKDREWLQPK